MTKMEPSPHRIYRELVDRIERNCRVVEWRSGDIDLWPLASQDLFLDIFRNSGADTAPPPQPFAIRAASTLATPATNLWKSRADVVHWVPRPYRTDSILFGDGVSLDRIDGAWHDRFGEPIVAALERQGRSCFVMQSGNLTRLPWARPTYSANQVGARAAVKAALTKVPNVDLPEHSAVMELLNLAAIAAPSLTRERLGRRARAVLAQAAAFDRLLKRVQPKVAFVVTYYAGLGHAFALACRRRGILCVDVQHCPHDGPHRAYSWSQVPARGYSTVPGLFWTWGDRDAALVRRWNGSPWHRSIFGGHTQIAMFCHMESELLCQKLCSQDARFDREILIALQPIGGRSDTWKALAAEIESAPPSWRWWIRRHPASTSVQNREYAHLLSLQGRNMIADERAEIPLPILLRHMDAVVSLASGAAAEAAMFGVPAFFLDDEARDTFPGLLARGHAAVIDARSLVPAIARTPANRVPMSIVAPAIEDTLGEIDRLAEEYSLLCREMAFKKIDRSYGIVRECQPPCAA